MISPLRRCLLHGGDREFAVHPETETALERAHPRDALALQLQRHPGARRFVRSGAVQDSSATIQSAPGMAYGAAFTSSTERVSTTASVSSPMSRRPLSSSGVIPRGPETAEKPPALDDLDHDVTRERRPDDDDDPVAEVTGT